MRYTLVAILLALLCNTNDLFAQETLEKLESLQKTLQELEKDLDKKQEITITKEAFQALLKERDSLKILTEVLKSELLLLQTKQEVKEQKQIKQQKTPSVNLTDLKGYYIVRESERDKKQAESTLEKFKKMYQDSPLIVVQNHRKTWYHVCISKSYEWNEIGSKVKEARKKGSIKAWWIQF